MDSEDHGWIWIRIRRRVAHYLAEFLMLRVPDVHDEARQATKEGNEIRANRIRQHADDMCESSHAIHRALDEDQEP